MSPELFVSRAKAPAAKRSEKGYGDENVFCYVQNTEILSTAGKEDNNQYNGVLNLPCLAILDLTTLQGLPFCYIQNSIVKQFYTFNN